jgi:hypothetical protein
MENGKWKMKNGKWKMENRELLLIMKKEIHRKSNTLSGFAFSILYFPSCIIPFLFSPLRGSLSW